jgi:diaminopimelate decarboxylase
MFESTVNKSKNEIQRIIIKNQERIAREEQEQMNRFNKVNLGKSQSQRRINVNEEEDKEQDRIYVHALSDDDDNDDDEVDENETIDLGDIPDDDLNFNYEELLQKAIDINDEIAVKKLTQLSVLQASNRRKEVDFFVRYYLDLYDKDKQETKVYKIASQISNMKDIDYVSTYLDLKSKGFL